MKMKMKNEKIWITNKKKNIQTTESQKENALGLVSKNMTKWLRESLLGFQ